MAKIIVIHGCLYALDLMKRRLTDHIVLSTNNLSEGRELFLKNPDIDIIVVDYFEGAVDLDSIAFIKNLVEEGFDKPIIANTNDDLHNNVLIEAGATHYNIKPIMIRGTIDKIVEGSKNA